MTDQHHYQASFLPVLIGWILVTHIIMCPIYIGWVYKHICQNIQMNMLYVSVVLSQYEELRVELGSVQRELVGVREQAQGEARARDRLTQELQAKVAQVCSLEGQLDSVRTLVQNLTQEVKRWVKLSNSVTTRVRETTTKMMHGTILVSASAWQLCQQAEGLAGNLNSLFVISVSFTQCLCLCRKLVS